MLKVLLLFALLIAGIVFGPMMAGHQGYVLIQTDNYNIETSVTNLVIMLILAMLVLFAIEWLLRRIFHTGARTRGWFTGRKRRRARKQTEQALLKLAEGRQLPAGRRGRPAARRRNPRQPAPGARCRSRWRRSDPGRDHPRAPAAGPQ